MGFKELPVTYVFTCDGCGNETTSKSKGRPKYWAELIFRQDAYDYQGSAVADGTIARFFCGACRESFSKAMNDWVQTRKPTPGPRT